MNASSDLCNGFADSCIVKGVVLRSGGARTAAEGAFDTFVRSERAALLRTAVLLVSSRADAEDAVQDSMAAVSARWDELDRPAAYARACVVNACKMQLRTRERAARTPPDTDVASETPSSLIELHGALARLSPDERAAIVLRYLIDLPEAEIAEALGCRPSTVRSHIRRGLAKLRKELS